MSPSPTRKKTGKTPGGLTCDSMKAFFSRLARLERLESTGACLDTMPSLGDILTHFEVVNGLSVGSVSRTPAQAESKGYSSICAELASLCGMSYGEMVEVLKAWKSR